MFWRRVLWVSVFAVGFAYVESAVVVYLRELFYPEGFGFPLKSIPRPLLFVEVGRELATLLILAAVGWLAGSTRWTRFASFALAFGVWDIFYYLWLYLLIGWPASILEWDVLFLIPLPWIGPVIAPVLISVVLVSAGLLIMAKEEVDGCFSPGVPAWILSSLGTIIILYSFLHDLDATIGFELPRPYRFDLLLFGLLCYSAAIILVLLRRPAAEL